MALAKYSSGIWGFCMTTNTAIAVIRESDQRSFATRELDFATIETAVMETIRGQWFLKEYARRNRHADTQQVLAAIDKLASRMAGPPADANLDRIRMDLKEMAEAISHTKHEIAAINHDGQGESEILIASGELDSIVSETEQATSSILEAAEQVQEAAWIMREDGVNPDMCDTLDGLATRIYTACSFQDITGQRISKVIGALNTLEDRIHAMSEIWDVDGWSKSDEAASNAAPSAGQHNRNVTGQNDVDQVMIDIESALDLESGGSAADEDQQLSISDPAAKDTSSPQQNLLDQLPAAELPQSAAADVASGLADLAEVVLPEELSEELPEEMDVPDNPFISEDSLEAADQITEQVLDELADGPTANAADYAARQAGEDEGLTSPAAAIDDDDMDVHFADPEPAESEVPAANADRQGASKTSAINMSALSQDDMHALFYC